MGEIENFGSLHELFGINRELSEVKSNYSASRWGLQIMMFFILVR